MKSLRTAAALAALTCLSLAPPAGAAALKTAVFAGGCFWSAEKAMESLPGVTDVVSGYAGGALKNPTYENHRGHLEAVKVTYDPARISYAKLVDGFFHHIDPTDAGGQICDRGPSYTTAVFVADNAETATAQAVKAQVAKTLGKPVATRILTGGQFWRAEAYHQDYAKKNPANYNAYRIGCGRDRALKAVWGPASR
ncbi:peptide methionine sulfoxide reductase [Phenylobacterium sp. Root77]|uniref:peptide-methionine (S)-S-oxide reductase MsrA n=1 Tax=unclassified Phenylobacterium TaxID=2640670 RepID=UPI0006F44001|nr:MULTISPECIES: peptide-methionine (S)-S-oxide reductase MsrA [unclassified Phenylobacterium]KQW71062.1 peptide methionine sulfoxide reductase [Phenylobacterium sp. Root1277]KQW95779.1 peptide methionine sulfoxide reductase [Phenylobacterium sp. Root1290]KRC41565.1 peptide methionine sulfoxide reductase [Phenylobacterium sp. Root77]